MWFTTSWDDGHPLDLKLAGLMARHGIAGTFYCPLRNVEGLPTLDAGGLRALASPLCEIGGHTLDHAYATRMPADAWAAQVRDGRDALEQLLGHRVAGFCYPGGKHPGPCRRIVAEAGFSYARTVQNFCLQPGSDPFLVPTTLQVYAHSSQVLLRNLASGGDWLRRAPVALATLRRGDLLSRLEALLDLACAQEGAVLHIWGHSWEIEATGQWDLLDRFFHMVAERVPGERRATNLGVMRALNLVAATQVTGDAADTPAGAYSSCP